MINPLVAVFFSVLAGVFGWVLFNVAIVGGALKQIHPHFDGICRTVEGAVGADDIVIDHRDGAVFVSSMDRRAMLEGGPTNGAIYRYSIKASQPALINLTPDANSAFAPHGLSFYPYKSGGGRLFVVNHQAWEESIEVFDWQDKQLTHVKTLKSPLLISGNDIYAINEDEFYVANDHQVSSLLGKGLQDLLGISSGNILHYRAGVFRIVDNNIGYANSMVANEEGSLLYLSALTERALRIYQRDNLSGDLHYQKSVLLHSAVDNLDRDAEGNLWVASHPQLTKFVAHMFDPVNLSPSQVFRVSVDDDLDSIIDEIYLEPGDRLSGASVAAVWNKTMLLGSVMDTKFLDCQLP